MFPRGGDREREAYGVERGVSRRLTNFRPCNEDEGFLISGMDEEFRVLGREKKKKKEREKKVQRRIYRREIPFCGCGTGGAGGRASCVETIFILPPRGKWNYVFR